MNYWLFDFKLDDDLHDFWMKKLGRDDFTLIGTERTKNRFGYWIKGAKHILDISKQEDIIFCWFDFQAVVCFVLSKILLRKRYIVAQNVMLKFNKTLKGRIYALLYKWALSSEHFYATVQSREYGELINNNLKININFELIHDPNLEKYYIKNREDIKAISNSVFMGGTSSRDWKFAFEIAKRMPDVKFNFVMTKKMYIKYYDYIIDNTKVFYDIPKEQFNSLAYVSSIIIMPTNTDAPAGLMLMYLAAANNKLYITNYSATSSEYINNDRGCIIPKDIDLWIREIRYYLDYPNEAEKKAENLREFIESECTPEQFVAGMNRICYKITGGKSGRVDEECNQR